jgi:MFS family permease
MDHTGAIVGPLLATAILFFAPQQYRLLFGLTIIPGAIAVALLFFVNEEAPVEPGHTSTPDTDVQREERHAAYKGSARLPGRVTAVLGVLLVFGLGNSADAFLLLRLSDALGGATYVPLLWAALHVVKASLSTWGGGLSDRFGRKQMIGAGWIVYALVYAGFAWSTSAVVFIAWFLFYGVYFAFAEGPEKALVADLTPVERRGAAFGWYNATTGIGALIASVLFGELYERFGAPTAFLVGAALAGAAAVLLLLIPTDTIRNSDARNPGHQ